MKVLIFFELLPVALAASGALYITELPQYQNLVPCAASALSYAVQYLTASKCPTDAPALQSCACTKDNNAVAVGSSITKAVQTYCALTASDDVTSANSVFAQYCNPGSVVPSATKASGGVTQYMTDIAQMTDMAPCASSALAYAVNSFTYELCPKDAAGLQSCVCTKNQNSVVATQAINDRVGSACGATHSEDKASAQGMFSGYCGLAGGSSAFPTPSYLPGAVTYYITDLPQFSSLAPCAKSGLSYQMFTMTYNLCPSDPKAFVSCACVKDNNSAGFSAGIVSQVKGFCSSTASDDVTSALGVLDYYCSAGKGDVTPQGVTASVTNTVAGSKPTTTNKIIGAGATSTSGSGSGSGSSSAGSGSSTGPATSNTRRIPIVPIVGGVAGAAVLAFVGIVACCCYRRNRRRRAQLAGPPQPQLPDTANFGKLELANNETSTAHTVSPVVRKATPMSIINRPVSPMEEGPKTYPGPNVGASEMLAPAAPYRAELQPASPTMNRAEMHTPSGGGRSDVPLQELPPGQQYQQSYQHPQAYQPVQQYPSPYTSPHPSPAPFYNEAPGSVPHPGQSPQPMPGHEMSANNAGPYEMSGQAWR